MNTIYRNILAAFTIFAAVSCYKDLGSYDYEEINEIVITTDTYTYPLGVSSTITIEPVVTQTLVQGTDNLAYEWKLQSGTSWEVVGDGPVYELKIGPEDVQPYSFIFSVTDTGIGITTYAEITVNPVSAFDQSWFILQNVGGQAVLGSVGGEGDVDERAVSPVLEDVSLSGTPRFLGIHPYMNLGVPTSPDYVPLLGVFTSSDRYILNGFTMLPQSQLTYDRIVYGSKYAGEQNMPSSAGEPQIMKGQRNGFAIVAGGIVWYAVPDQYALMYPVKLSSVQADMFDYEAGDIERALTHDVFQFNVMCEPGYEKVLLDATKHLKATRWSDLFADVMPDAGGKDAGVRIAMRELGVRRGGDRRRDGQRQRGRPLRGDLRHRPHRRERHLERVRAPGPHRRPHSLSR